VFILSPKESTSHIFLLFFLQVLFSLLFLIFLLLFCVILILFKSLINFIFKDNTLHVSRSWFVFSSIFSTILRTWRYGFWEKEDFSFFFLFWISCLSRGRNRNRVKVYREFLFINLKYSMWKVSKNFKNFHVSEFNPTFREK